MKNLTKIIFILFFISQFPSCKQEDTVAKVEKLLGIELSEENIYYYEYNYLHELSSPRGIFIKIVNPSKRTIYDLKSKNHVFLDSIYFKTEASELVYRNMDPIEIEEDSLFFKEIPKWWFKNRKDANATYGSSYNCDNNTYISFNPRIKNRILLKEQDNDLYIFLECFANYTNEYNWNRELE